MPAQEERLNTEEDHHTGYILHYIRGKGQMCTKVNGEAGGACEAGVELRGVAIRL